MLYYVMELRHTQKGGLDSVSSGCSHKFRQEENRIWILALRAVLVTLLVVILLVVLKRNGIVARGQDVPVQYVEETMGRCANGVPDIRL